MARRVRETGCATRSGSPTRVSRRRPTSWPPTRSHPTPHTWRGRCGSRARRRARALRPTSSATTRASTTPAQNTVRFFLGSGAAAGQGGTLAVAGAPGDTAQISFEVRVDDNLTAEHEIRNVAQATFIAPTLGKQLTALSSETIVSATPGPTPSEPADLDLAQSETVAPAAFGNDAVDDHVTIENNGPGDATDVVLHDVVPPGATIDSATIDQGSCTVSATDVTCVVPSPRRRRIRRGRRRARRARRTMPWPARRARPASARLSSTRLRRATAARRPPRCRSPGRPDGGSRRPGPRERVAGLARRGPDRHDHRHQQRSR